MNETPATPAPAGAPRREPPGTGAIFLAALRLGLTSFGGPVAHLAYFRREYVERRGWLDHALFGELVALAQFLPGPASSKCGFAVGYLCGGIRGAVAAWLGFTLPSALLMMAAGIAGAPWLARTGSGWLAGLKIAVVAIVAQAVWQLGRTFCAGVRPALLAAAAAAALLAVPGAWMQLAVLTAGAAAGAGWFASPGVVSDSNLTAVAASRRQGLAWLALFGALLAAGTLAAPGTWPAFARLLAELYRAGALVFGGGHVVLPLLDSGIVAPGFISSDEFLAGYAVAQAMPGPLFSIGGYIGAVSSVGPGGWLGGTLGLIALFLPGLLLVLAAWPFWLRLRRSARVRGALAGANAVVVGILGAALVDPVITHGITSWPALALAVGAALALFCRVPGWLVVLLAAGGGALVFHGH